MINDVFWLATVSYIIIWLQAIMIIHYALKLLILNHNSLLITQCMKLLTSSYATIHSTLKYSLFLANSVKNYSPICYYPIFTTILEIQLKQFAGLEIRETKCFFFSNLEAEVTNIRRGRLSILWRVRKCFRFPDFYEFPVPESKRIPIRRPRHSLRPWKSWIVFLKKKVRIYKNGATYSGGFLLLYV